jgi:hypothetical protein
MLHLIHPNSHGSPRATHLAQLQSPVLRLPVAEGVGADTKAAGKRYKRVASATALIWKILMIAESRFRHLNAARLLGHVAQGAADVA